jgi:hypothetical protein
LIAAYTRTADAPKEPIIKGKSIGSKKFEERYPHKPIPITEPDHDQNTSADPTPGGLFAPPFIFDR